MHPQVVGQSDLVEVRGRKFEPRDRFERSGKDIEEWNARKGIETEVTETVRGVPYIGSPLGQVLQLADFDDDHIMILSREAENGALSLSTRSKRWL